jgi:peptide/nickel transport system substrate-binding protein
MTRWARRIILTALSIAAGLMTPAAATVYQEPPVLMEAVERGTLPRLAERLPEVPSVASFARQNQVPGRHGGTLNILMARPKDVRLMVVYGYARLMRYDHRLELVPDILRKVDVKEGRIFTLHLRPGHRWSDGAPFTAEDFRYYWENIANNPQLTPTGPPDMLRVEGELPEFEVVDPHTVRYSWRKPNPAFLPAMAKARPPFIYRPAHYLRRFHAAYFDVGTLRKMAKKRGYRSWAPLHNRMDNLYKNDNPALPTLQPWINTTKPPADRFVFVRNPYFHRVDPNGRQLPYIDRVVMDVVDKKIVPAKTGTGGSDLQARYLRFDNFTFLRKNGKRLDFDVNLWRIGKGAHMALYPNLNVKDPGWRVLLRDVRFRRALSLAVHRREINRVMYFGQAIEGQNTVLPSSPLFDPAYQKAWADFDLDQANTLLDEMGLTKRNDRGIRQMPDGRPIEIVVETAGESTEESDVLQLVHDSWLRAGIKLHIKPSHRDVLRNRIYAGQTVMSLSSGLENGLATPESSPRELAPTRQRQYQWPQWGQFTETAGQAGASPDMPVAWKLLDLLGEWRNATTRRGRAQVWRKMLSIYTDQVFTIGLIAGTLQPVVVSKRLRNVPEHGHYTWNPGAHFGIYEPDTFWFVAPEQVTEDRRK